jgi:hypothetical protein
MEKATLDFINSFGFELVSCIFLSLNIIALYRDKVVKGLSLLSAGFYATWACWNVFYYFHLDQPASFWVAIPVAVLTTWWIVLAWWYRHTNKLNQ